jgi:hypothetical protein
MKRIVKVCFSLAMFVASPVFGDVIQLASQSRSVSVINDKGYSENNSVSGFERFNQSLESVPWNDYSVTASQDSVISPDGVTAQGHVTCAGPFLYNFEENYYQKASSSFQLEFEINAPREVTLTGTLFLYGDTGGYNTNYSDLWVKLSGNAGNIFSAVLWSQHSSVYRQQINETFSLDTGSYTLIVYAGSFEGYSMGTGGGGEVSYDITFAPEPATLLLLGVGGIFLQSRKL